jgi:YVTN family beta-propeller protein
MPILFFMTIYGEYFIIKYIENKNFPIIVGLVPTQLYYDDENNQLYVSNTNSHTVSVIKTRSNFIKFNLISGSNPYGIMHDKIKDHIYISNLNSNDTYIFDDDTFNLITKVTVGKTPTSIISLNDYIYVTNFDNNTLSMVNYTNNIFDVTNIKVGKNPVDSIVVPGLSSQKSDDRIYVVNKGSNKISIINPLSHKVLDNIDVGGQPFSIDFYPDNHKLYIANHGSKSISIIDSIRNAYLGEIFLNFTPTDLIVNKNNNSLYISESSNDKDKGTNAIHIIKLDSSTNSVTNNTLENLNETKVNLIKPPERLALDEDNGILYLSNPFNGSISIFDTNTNKEITERVFSDHYLSMYFFLGFDIILLLSIIVILCIIIYYHIKNILHPTNVKETKDIVFTLMLSLLITPVILVISNLQFTEITQILYEMQLEKLREIVEPLLLSVNYILYILTAFIFFIYPPYPLIFFSFLKNYFSNIGEDVAVIEYNYFKYIYIILAILLILLSPIILLSSETQSLFQYFLPNDYTIENTLENSNWRMVHGIMLITFLISSFKLLFVKYYLVKRHGLLLIYAKGYIKIALKNKGKEMLEIKNLKKCLTLYNHYIYENFNLYISKLEYIFSQLSRLSRLEKDKFIKDIASIFIGGENEKNKLSPVDKEELLPARYLFNFLHLPESEQFLIKKSFTANIKSYIETIAIIIPIILGILEVYFKLGGHI